MNSSLSLLANAHGLDHLCKSQVRDYLVLLKPRVMSLVVFSGAAGLWLAPGHIHPLIAMVAVLCITLGSGASGILNMWYDRDIDCLMARTKNRPIPAGRIDPDDALQFGLFLAVFSVTMMAIAVNYLSALLLAIAIIFYVCVYTMWLKRRTPQNIVIGGASGALPPMIGWAAVTGDITVDSLLLFLLIFVWTPPHFWALALSQANDYRNASVPMLPVVKGEKATKRQIVIYTIALFICSVLPVAIGMSGMVYLAVACILSTIFLYLAWRTYLTESYYYAKLTFAFSIIYLFLLFTFLVVDRIIQLIG